MGGGGASKSESQRIRVFGVRLLHRPVVEGLDRDHLVVENPQGTLQEKQSPLDLLLIVFTHPWAPSCHEGLGLPYALSVFDAFPGWHALTVVRAQQEGTNGVDVERRRVFRRVDDRPWDGRERERARRISALPEFRIAVVSFDDLASRGVVRLRSRCWSRVPSAG